MRVLHLFSNAKWTGPAEPALGLCVALRAHGIEADFACSPHAPGGPNKVVETARDRGVEPILSMRLAKHRRPLANWMDRRKLRQILQQQRYDLVHCHLDNDHRIAAPVASALETPLVRSSYHGEGFPAPEQVRAMLAATAWLIEPSRRALERDRNAGLIAEERATVVSGAVDIQRFDPQRETPDGRRWLNIPADAFVVGIVARMQPHRRYDDFFEAMQRLAAKHANVHAIVVGRGSKQESVGLEPVRALGLEDRVHFPGFIDGENYAGMLRAFDVKVFLVPGSDGTCRAVREALAMGRPAVVSRRGMLPELVEDGVTGFVTDGTPEGLYQALDRLCVNRALRRRLGHAARRAAVERFAPNVQAAAVADVYEKALAACSRRA